jgi:hypothetical protein
VTEPYLDEQNSECIHSKKSNDTKPTTASKTDTESAKDLDTPIITHQESQIINQLATIMSTTMIANISTILQGTTGLLQTTTAPQGGGRSGPPGGGMPTGQPAGGGPPTGPPGGGGRLPAGGPPEGVPPAAMATAMPNIPGVQNSTLKGAMPTTFDGDRARTNQFIQEFGLYCVINLDNATIVSPF